MNYFKKCTKCLEWKDFPDFASGVDSFDGLHAWCKECASKSAREWYHSNKDRHRIAKRAWSEKNRNKLNKAMRDWRKKHPESYRAAHLKRHFGFSLSQYNDFVLKQDGKCAICLNPPKKVLAVDHDHKTGKFRGLLCGSCNRAIGLLKDSPVVVKNAFEYLERTCGL